MNDTAKVIDAVDKLTDILFLTLMLIQQISSKTQDEILDAIKTEGAKTDELLKKLR